MALMRDLNQYLQKRGERWHYVRRVPSEYSHIDDRVFVRKSLKTESLELARLKRDDLVKADDAYWIDLLDSTGRGANDNETLAEAIRAYESAVRRALAKGFTYKSQSELIAHANTREILDRLESLESGGKGHLTVVPNKSEAEAVLGMVTRPKVTLSQAFEIYCSQIAIGDLIGKSDAQKAAWRKVKLRAVNYFIDLHGDIPIDTITRDHARAMYSWWGERLVPKDGQKALNPNSANRDLGNLRKLYREYYAFEGQEDRPNPFRGLRYADKGIKDIPHFEDSWVRTRLLNPSVFKGLKPESILLVYALIETGCRPSEIANITHENIILEAEVPHIRIRPSQDRQLKSSASIRDIPLTGVSLEAFKLTPNGFPHYRDKSSLLSNSLMKAFRIRDLFPSKDHRVYSFRHSFEKRMLEAGLDYGLRCLLMGHKHDRPSYGDGGSLTYRQQELLKITHPVPEGFTDTLKRICT